MKSRRGSSGRGAHVFAVTSRLDFVVRDPGMVVFFGLMVEEVVEAVVGYFDSGPDRQDSPPVARPRRPI
jgi:hypothetical protein